MEGQTRRKFDQLGLGQADAFQMDRPGGIGMMEAQAAELAGRQASVGERARIGAAQSAEQAAQQRRGAMLLGGGPGAARAAQQDIGMYRQEQGRDEITRKLQEQQMLDQMRAQQMQGMTGAQQRFGEVNLGAEQKQRELYGQMLGLEQQGEMFQASQRGRAQEAEMGQEAPWEKLARVGIGIGSLFASDRRLKTAERQTGVSPNGIPIYQFSYKDDPEARTYQGTMAQDLLTTHPNAVHLGPDGFYAVDYSLIDIPFTEVD